MGINLNQYNKYNKKFWINETLERKKNYFTYTFNRYTLRATFLVLKEITLKTKINLFKPAGSKEEFWQHEITNTAKKFYEQFELPEKYFNELKEITEYCDNNEIKIIFVILPTHTDFQQRSKDFGLAETEQVFKTELQSLGDVYDFNYPSEITSDKEKYWDPMHFNDEIANIICDEIFTQELFYARFSRKPLDQN